MKISDVIELFYITNIQNVPSILEFGILSHNEIKKRKMKFQNIAFNEVQERRESKRINRKLVLHDFANLYFHARNPMLYVLINRMGLIKNLCILQIKPEAMMIEDAIISTQNAACTFVRFAESPSGLIYLDKELVYAKVWIHDDPFEELRRKQIKCAELLIPNKLDPSYILGGYVANNETKKILLSLLTTSPRALNITVNKYIFFE